MLRVVHRKAFKRHIYMSRGQFHHPLITATKPRGVGEIQIPRQALGAFGRYGFTRRRSLGGIPTVLLPPMVFGGLVIALWTWKCCMMVLFQNKIIYMPGLPPNARGETIEEYRSQCGGVEWTEEKIRSLDGTRISLCVASVNDLEISGGTMVYILYFQGNASSIPPRLPFLSPVLRMLRDHGRGASVRYTMVCCSYRGYWTSKGRPSEKGIAKDAAGSLDWIRDDFLRHSGKTTQSIPVVIWGQSIGAGVATSLAAESLPFQTPEPKVSIQTLILETPFISVRAMLETLYPQKWLPYRHLWPFLWNHLDSFKALGVMAQRCKDTGMETPKIVLLEAGKDELVPKMHGDALERRCREVGLDAKKVTVGGAYHTEVMVRPEGRMAVIEAIEQVSRPSLASRSRGS